MNCLYITLFFNIVAGIVQTFIKSWNQLLYPRVIEVCRQPFESRHDFFLHPIIVVQLSGVWWKTHFSFPATMESRNSSPSCAWRVRNFSAEPIRFVRMTECNSHLAGLWIGAAISNTSHSNKAGSTTVKRARLTGKGSRSTAVLP